MFVNKVGYLDKLLADRGVYPRVRGQHGVVQQAYSFQPAVNPIPVGKETKKTLVALPKGLAHGAEALEGGLRAPTRRQALRRCAPHRENDYPILCLNARSKPHFVNSPKQIMRVQGGTHCMRAVTHTFLLLQTTRTVASRCAQNCRQLQTIAS